MGGAAGRGRRIRRQLLQGLMLAALAAGLSLPAGARTSLNDPTQPTGTVAGHRSPAGHWHLSSTLVGPGRRVAVINGHTLGEGDRLGPARVKRIDHGRVQLNVDGRTLILHLVPQDARRKTARKRSKP